MKVQNGEYIDQVKQALKVPELQEFNMAQQVVPVVVLPRRATIHRQADRTSTGSGTLLTTENTNRRFYITNATLNHSHDAASDATFCSITITNDGATRSILRLAFVAGVAVNCVGHTISYPVPIPVDANSVISVTCTFTAGVHSSAASITGYYE